MGQGIGKEEPLKVTLKVRAIMGQGFKSVIGEASGLRFKLQLPTRQRCDCGRVASPL